MKFPTNFDLGVKYVEAFVDTARPLPIVWDFQQSLNFINLVNHSIHTIFNSFIGIGNNFYRDDNFVHLYIQMIGEMVKVEHVVSSINYNIPGDNMVTVVYSSDTDASCELRTITMNEQMEIFVYQFYVEYSLAVVLWTFFTEMEVELTDFNKIEVDKDGELVEFIGYMSKLIDRRSSNIINQLVTDCLMDVKTRKILFISNYFCVLMTINKNNLCEDDNSISLTVIRKICFNGDTKREICIYRLTPFFKCIILNEPNFMVEHYKSVERLSFIAKKLQGVVNDLKGKVSVWNDID